MFEGCVFSREDSHWSHFFHFCNLGCAIARFDKPQQSYMILRPSGQSDVARCIKDAGNHLQNVSSWAQLRGSGTINTLLRTTTNVEKQQHASGLENLGGVGITSPALQL